MPRNWGSGSWTGKADAFYSSRKWRGLRAKHIEENPLDELKEQYGIVEVGEIVDHIIPRDVCKELEMCEYNLQTLSFLSHQQKTATTRGITDLNEFVRELRKGKLQYICTEERKDRLIQHLKSIGLIE